MITKANLADSIVATGASGTISIPMAPHEPMSYLVPLLAGILAPILKVGGQLLLENLNEKIQRRKDAPDVPPPFSPHFALEEFHSNDGTKVPVHLYPNLQRLMEQLEILRNECGPLVITSGFRSPKHNKAVGGAKNSMHLQALAADLKPLDCSPYELAQAIIRMRKQNKLAPGGLGIYPSFIHFDLGAPRIWYKN